MKVERQWKRVWLTDMLGFIRRHFLEVSWSGYGEEALQADWFDLAGACIPMGESLSLRSLLHSVMLGPTFAKRITR
jgi:hypothetical protein